jgi:hypothetical protein
MKQCFRFLAGFLFVMSSFAANALAQHTIWHSPMYFSTADARLTIGPGSPTNTIRVKTSQAGDLQWIELGLVLPSNVKIDTVIVCHELNSSASFISQVRLSKLTTPDAAFVQHDDGTDLTDVGPRCYSSLVGGLMVEGTITLSLRLNFASTADWIDIGGIGIVVSPLTTSVQQSRNNAIPEDFALKQNFPNPFNAGTVIEYDIQKPGNTVLRIYNELGQLVRTLIEENKSAGSYRILWDGKDNNGQRVATGHYFYQLRVDDFVSAKRMLLLK